MHYAQSSGHYKNCGGVCAAKHERLRTPRNCQHSTHYGETEVQTDRVSSVGTERRAYAILWEFNSQNAANTLWVYATMGRKPGERMMEQLQRRVQAISREFNSQVVANTLWAYATMGRKPGADDGAAGAQTEAILWEFNSQNVANTLGVCDNGDQAGAADDGSSGAAGGGDIRGSTRRLLQTRCGRMQQWGESRGADDGGFNSQDIANTLWAICFFFVHFESALVHFESALRFCCFLYYSFPIDVDDE